jgi:hypothetical protein
LSHAAMSAEGETEAPNEIFELWGCGFNQFGQLDKGSRDDVFQLKLITSDTIVSVIWAGWADAVCTLSLLEDVETSRLPFKRELEKGSYKYHRARENLLRRLYS